MHGFILVLLFFAAFVLGSAKAGVKGVGTLGIAILASLFGAKESTGVVVPILLVGDVLAVWYYNRYCKLKYLFKFMPAMMVGIVVAVLFGKGIPEEQFKILMGIIILIGVTIMWWRERQSQVSFPNNWFFAGSIGVIAGITTMIGNLAGPFVNIFFLSTRLPKNEFIATSAWLYLLMNLFKLPFHIFVWETINTSSLIKSAWLSLALLVGFAAGIRVVGWFKENSYRRFILIMTAISAILIFVR